MRLRSKMLAVPVGVALLMCSFMGSAIAGNPLEDLANKIGSDFKKINEQGERDRAAIRAKQQGGTSSAGEVAVTEETDAPPIQMVVPNDAKTKAAIDAALPNIKKILAIHRCIKEPQQLLQLNSLAIPGANMMAGAPSNGLPMYSFPNNKGIFLKYHDPSKCVDIRAIDRFVMLALNAMSFRVVYFARDSGETINFGFLLKKGDDGSWLLGQPPDKVN